MLKLKNRKISAQNTNLRTINGEKRTKGIVKINVKIFEIQEETDLLVIDEENFDYDVLIGLDMIKKFKLSQDENLNIAQKIRDREEEKYQDSKEKKERLKEENKNENTSEEKVWEKYSINFNEHIERKNLKIRINPSDGKKKRGNR